MKILMVNKFLYPNGGSETYIFEVGKQLEKMGHEVQYFGMEHEGRVAGNRVESYTSNMDFHTGKLGKLLYPFRIIYSREARKKIRAVLEDFEPDVVHLNNFNFQLTPSIIYEIRKFGRERQKKLPILYTAHDSQLVCPNHLMQNPLTGKKCMKCMEKGLTSCVKGKCIHGSFAKSVLGALEGWIYKSMGTYRYLNHVICPSDFMRERLQSSEALKDKLIVMHNFVSEDMVREKGKKDKQEYVIYFGRYSSEKGIQTLVNVCKMLPEVDFVFAGNGPLEAEVRSCPNVVNKGFLNGKELYEVISKALFAVVPSECYENCPFSVMEALSLGTPVIGSRLGGIPELVDEGKNGELFESGDADALRDKIWKLWNDRELVAFYQDNCFEKKFDSVEEYCEKLLEIYQTGGITL